MITEIKEALQDFRENPMEGLIFLLPVVILGISIVSGIVGYVSFIRQNGYKNQFAVIKSEGIMESFTKGTSTFGIKGPIGTTIIILLIIQVLVMLIAYFINSDGNAVMITDIVGVVVLVGGICLTQWQEYNWGTSFIRGIISFIGKYKELDINHVEEIVLGCMGIAAIALIIGFGILLAKEYEEGVLLTLFCAAMNYVAIPLIILFLENIIPLLILIVVGIIIVIGLVTGLGESGGSSVGESSVSRTESREPSSNQNTTSKKAEPEKTQERKANSSYIENYSEAGGTCLHKVKSSWGEDYIELDNFIVTRRICSIKALEKGEYHIYDKKNGREITSAEILWKK